MPKTKKHQARRREILAAAEKLFFQKGYAPTTINDILAAVKIAKGTFYHYFKSKQQVMHAIILHHMEKNAEMLTEIANNPKLTALEKMRKLTITNYPNTTKQRTMTKMQLQDNAQMHLKVLVDAVQTFAPILQRVIEQGVKEGSFRTPYPFESMELIMIMYQFIFAGDIFPMTPKEAATKAKAYAHFIERILDVKPGTMDYMQKRYKPAHATFLNKTAY